MEFRIRSVRLLFALPLVLASLAAPTATAQAVGLADGITWTSRTSVSDSVWHDVAYGNGLFVAVAQMGGSQVMTSPDGVTWTARSVPVANEWLGVTYGNGLFVVVAQTGSGNRAMTSPDGINWTIRSTPADNNWRAITYGNGMFVAVAYFGGPERVMTSPDGINWTARTPPAINGWNNVTYANGLFVAVANSGTGNRVMTSPDGITWTSRSTVGADNNWWDVTYGNGTFVAVAQSGVGNRVMTSPDGINWTIRSTPADNMWRSVTFGNGLFVAVAFTGTGNRVMTSPDGVTWTLRASAADNDWLAVEYAYGRFVAVGASGTGNRVMTNGTFDATPPSAVSLSSGPDEGAAVFAPADVTFEFSASDGPSGTGVTGYRCRLESPSSAGSWGTCPSSQSYSSLTDGSYSLSVRAVDAVGNEGPVTVRSWTVRPRVPDGRLDEEVPAFLSAASVTLRFSADLAGSSFRCRVDNGAWETCVSPATFPLDEGVHSVSVQAISAYGVVDPEPLSVAIVIDRTAPTVDFESTSVKAGRRTNDPGFRARLRANEAGVRFECRLNGGVWKDCGTDPRYLGLSAGKQVLEVRAIDRAGNVSATTQKTWTLQGASTPLTVTPLTDAGTLGCDDAELTGVQRVAYRWRRDTTMLKTTKRRYTITDRDSGSRLTCQADVTFASGATTTFTAPAILVDGATRLTNLRAANSKRRGPVATYTLNRDHLVVVRLWCRSTTNTCKPPSKPTDFVKPAHASYVPAGLTKYRRITIAATKGTNTVRFDEFLPKGLPAGDYKITIRLARRSKTGRLTTTNFTHQDLRITG